MIRNVGAMDKLGLTFNFIRVWSEYGDRVW